MPSAHDIARHIIWVADQEKEASVTHLQLQKLLYYIQGWSLAIRGRPMFPDRIEAWRYGPVVRDLYPLFRPAGYDPIKVRPSDGDVDLSADDGAFVESVWESYKQYSAQGLRKKTHEEDPWKDTWGDRPDTDEGSDEITHDALIRFFKHKELKKCAIPGLEPDRVYANAQKPGEGRWYTRDEIWADD